VGRGKHRIAGAVVALALGVGVGRFVTYEPASASSPVSVASLQSEAAEAVRSAASTGDPSFYERAEVALDRADELVPDDPNTTLVRGALALALHRFDEALAFGTTAAAVNPSSAAAQGILVDANVELGKYDAASTSLQRMLDLRPDLAALSRASYVRELHGDRAGAVEAMAAAEEAGGSPFDVASVAALRGELAVAGGDLDGALAHYERALGLAPGLVLAEVGRARVLGATGQEGQAIEALQAVVDRVPVPAALVLLGELQSRTGDPSGAAGTFELVRATAALQQASGQVVDLEMAVFEADSGDPERAVELAERAAAARPDNVYVSDALGWALFRSGDAAAAVPHIEAALRLGSNDPVSLWHAAQVFAAVGSDARAADTLAGVAPSALAARLGQPVAQ
jgi:tetratricopeptide (TPR) repeat protein